MFHVRLPVRKGRIQGQMVTMSAPQMLEFKVWVPKCKNVEKRAKLVAATCATLYAKDGAFKE